MKDKYILLISIIVAGLMLGTAFYIKSDSRQNSGNGPAAVPVKEENGIQVIRILARGGYSPRQISVKAGMPIRIEMETSGTYDCSSVFVIPSLKYQKRLPPTGVTVIDVPAQGPGSSITGLCGMGMYSFEIKFY